MEKNITRRGAAKAIAMGAASAIIAPKALANVDADAELTRLEKSWLDALEAANQASYSADDLWFSLPEWIRKGPRLEAGKGADGTPLYITSDDMLEKELRFRSVSAEVIADKIAALPKEHREEASNKKIIKDWPGPNTYAEHKAKCDALRSDWETRKAEHQKAVEASGHPGLEKKARDAWGLVSQIETDIANTPAQGITGIAIKVRLFEWFIRDFEYGGAGDDGNDVQLMYGILRDLRTDPHP